MVFSGKYLGVKRSRVQIPAARLESAGQRPCLSACWRRCLAIPAKSTRATELGAPHTRDHFIVLAAAHRRRRTGRRPWHRQRRRDHPGTDGRRSAGRWPGHGRGRRLRLSRARRSGRAGSLPCDGARTASPIRGGRGRCEGIPDSVPPVRQSHRIAERCREHQSVRIAADSDLDMRPQLGQTEAGTSTTLDRCVFVSRSSSTPRCSVVPRSTVSRPGSSRCLSRRARASPGRNPQ